MGPVVPGWALVFEVEANRWEVQIFSTPYEGAPDRMFAPPPNLRAFNWRQVRCMSDIRIGAVVSLKPGADGWYFVQREEDSCFVDF